MNDPELYETENKLQKRDNKKIIKKYFHLIEWKSEESVIDIGCGTGNVTVHILLPKLPQTVKKITAVDMSEEMIKYASKNNPHEKVQYDVLDIGAKRMPDKFKGTFDRAFSFYCLHWIQNQKQAFENVKALLKPGGGFFGNILAKHPFFNVYETMAREDKWRLYTADYAKFATPLQNVIDPEEATRDLLEATGFTVLLCETEYKEYRYGDDISVKSFVASVNPFLGRMPEELIHDYLDEFVVHLQQYNKNIITSFYNNFTLFHKLVVVYAIKK